MYPTIATHATMRVMNIIVLIINFLEVKGASPPNGVTTIKDISPCFVPSRSIISRCHQNVTLLELLIIVNIDNKTPNTTAFIEDSDILGTYLKRDIFVELSNHLLVDLTEGARSTCSPVKVICFDVLNQGCHFVIHNHFLISHYIHSITYQLEYVKM